MGGNGNRCATAHRRGCIGSRHEAVAGWRNGCCEAGGRTRLRRARRGGPAGATPVSASIALAELAVRTSSVAWGRVAPAAARRSMKPVLRRLREAVFEPHAAAQEDTLCAAIPFAESIEPADPAGTAALDLKGADAPAAR